MIQAKDLRIGNLVLCQKTNESCHVALIHGYHPGTIGLTDIPHGYFFHDHITTIEGIPLTEEWLKKLGMVTTTPTSYGYVNGFQRNGVVVLNCPSENTTRFVYYRMNQENSQKKSLDILYVHQLQNLFFALTGEELQQS